MQVLTMVQNELDRTRLRKKLPSFWDAPMSHRFLLRLIMWNGNILLLTVVLVLREKHINKISVICVYSCDVFTELIS